MNILKLFVIILGLTMSGLALGMENTLTLPNASTINQRLTNLGLDYFVEVTKLDQKLGGQRKAPLGVAMSVDLAFADYSQSLKGHPMRAMLVTQIQMLKPNIIKILLQDNPAAIKQLEDVGLLEK